MPRPPSYPTRQSWPWCALTLNPPEPGEKGAAPAETFAPEVAGKGFQSVQPPSGPRAGAAEPAQESPGAAPVQRSPAAAQPPRPAGNGTARRAVGGNNGGVAPHGSAKSVAGAVAPAGSPRSEQFAAFQTDAPSCDNCGAITVRNGNCYLCHNCGNSMGCS